jgi:hypothetical protein
MKIRTSKHRAGRGWRGRIWLFATTLVVGAAGVAFASGWLLIPDQANGHAYGKGKHPGNGAPVVTVDYTLAALPGGYDLGPGETGDSILLQLHNPNPVAVTVTDILATTNTQLTSVSDASCHVGLAGLGDNSSQAITVHPQTGLALHIDPGADAAPMSVKVDTGQDFPSCFADALLNLGPLTVKAHN